MALEEVSDMLYAKRKEDDTFGKASAWLESVIALMERLGDAAEEEGKFNYPERDENDEHLDNRFNHVLNQYPDVRRTMMRINSSCVLHSTTSLNARVLPLIGRVGTLELSSGQPLVFKTTTPKQQDILRTSTVKAIGFVGSRIFVKTERGTQYTFEFQ